MLNHLKGLSGLLLTTTTLITVSDLSGVLPPKMAQALTTTSVAATRPATNSIAQSQSSGRINVVYRESNNPLSAELIRGYQRYGLFEKVGNLIASEINLPQDITIVLTDCGQANAAYMEDKHEIVLCSELTNESFQVLLKNGHSKEKALKEAIFASVFFALHEAGHMVAKELNLPVVGREEDAVDQFAAFFLLSNDSSETKSISGEIILSAAEVFALTSTEPGIHEYQDEHGLSQQRAFSLICILYGENPEEYSELVSKLDYTESRLGRCQLESKSIISAWQRLLKPYLN
jgi:Putative metallopeptidase